MKYEGEAEPEDFTDKTPEAIRSEGSIQMEEQYLRSQGLGLAIQLEEKYRGLTENSEAVQARVIANAEAFKNYIKG